MKNPHDKLFKRVLSRKSEAKALIQHFTPKWMSKMLDFRTLKRSETSYIGKKLKEHFLDIVYDCQTKSDEKIQISFLFEHKSYYDEQINDQLLGYLTEAYTAQYADEKKRIPIIPIVIYHGKEQWKSLRFSDSFSVKTENLRPFFPDFKYHLIDLNNIADDYLYQLEQGHFLRSTLILFKHYGDTPYLLEKTEEIFIFVKRPFTDEEKRSFLESFIHYIESIFRFNQKEEEHFVKKVEDMQVGIDFEQGSIAHEKYEEGKVEGKVEGAVLAKILIFLAFALNASESDFNQIRQKTRLSKEEFEVIKTAWKLPSVKEAIEYTKGKLALELNKKERKELFKAFQSHFK